MIRFAGAVAGVLLVLALAVAFAAANGGERVTLDLGLVVLYRFPVTFVAFGGLVLGMLVMLVATMHQDLETRRILRRRLAEEDREERSRYIDENQKDLFDEDPTLPPPPVGRPAPPSAVTEAEPAPDLDEADFEWPVSEPPGGAEPRSTETSRSADPWRPSTE